MAYACSNAFVADMIYIALSAKNTSNKDGFMFRCCVRFFFVRILYGWFSDSDHEEAREFGSCDDRGLI